ncbi:ABC transporter ATP-binding protein [Psychrobacillus sp. BL-248-WT-3]|uniref:ABC transporter ATP-binding protein n=1 Tax=Psychrobacillus sp. BL-248-WT-3 TaxID=2725306 RepID=UPI00146A42B3|nr:ABC transporter ATP-binding protein [Psychrobacillus sp. BL-248-WT-3]NME07733.1 ABC transporter ATP-binding protein [Psychrobacillus sp. BL-248-WT-3]
MEAKKILSLVNVSKQFGNKHVLNGVNLDVYEGQIIGYIGPNGAGKSTTVKLIIGLIDGYSGMIEIFGENIKRNNYTYKKRIGYVPETAELYENLTAYEYLVFTGEMYGLTTKEAEVKAFTLMKEFGLEAAFHQRLSSFSKGMKQKVLIISSLLHDPDLLFYDEPLSGLDANSVMVIKEILAKLAAQGKTIFYSSHIMDVVEKISNRIVLLVNGEVVADGSFEELKQQSQEGSLEGIFNQLTGFNEHEEIAERFVQTVSGGNLHE